MHTGLLDVLHDAADEHVFAVTTGVDVHFDGHVEETIEFVASLPANDRIRVVQETYESALILAEGYNHELLKSEAEMLEELEQALGEALPYRHSAYPLHGEKRGARPAA